jgi:solute carrier family 25 carnitine/acylcarnitine transporter 20/29
MFTDFINGSFGGFVGVIISHPIDTIKTRLQSGYTLKNSITMKHFYSGVKSPLIGIPLEKSIVFGFYNLANKHNINHFWSGIIGGFISTIVVTPIEYIKINQQNNISFSNLKINNIYKGFIPTVCRETPGFGIYFSTYNYLNSTYNNNNSLYKHFIFGGLSGISAWLFIYPADLIKTIIQHNNNSRTLLQIIHYIYKNNGLFGFYKGFHFAALRASSLHASVFFGYELIKKYN